MEVVTCEAGEGLSWELLYADDLVLVAESTGELLKKKVLRGRSAWRKNC